MGMFLQGKTAINAAQTIFYGKMQKETPQKKDVEQAKPSIKASLSSNSMIARIHNVRPGCGSCGK